MNSPEENLLPIGIQDWVASASELYSDEEYIRNAVRLALLLTRQLSQMAPRTARFLSLFDITTENVTILVWATDFLSINSAKFELGVLDGTNDVPLSSSWKTVNEALGEVMLRIFSKGASKDFDSSTAVDTSQAQGGQKRTMQPRTPGETSQPTSVEDLLLDSGMPLSICQIVYNLLSGPVIVRERPHCSDSFISLLQDEVWNLMSKAHPDAAAG